MISLQKVDNAIKFTFTDSQHYLYGDGVIAVPVNSLLLVGDKSDAVTFKKIDGDVFVSAPVAEFGMSKAEIEAFYKENMVGSTGGGDITSGEVQTMIDESISGKADTSSLATVATTGDYDDLLNKPTIPTVPTSNTAFTNDAGYITEDALSGYAESSAVTAVNDVLTAHTANTTIHVTAGDKLTWDGKQDALTAGTGIDITNDVISCTVTGGNNVVELTQAQYDALFDKDPDAFYIITDAPAIDLSGYVNTSAITSAVTSASTNSQIPTAKAVFDSLGQGGGGSYSAGDGIHIDENDVISTSYSGYPVFDSGTTIPEMNLSNFEGQCLILCPIDCEGSTQGEANFYVGGHNYHFTFYPETQTYDDNGDSSWWPYFTLEWNNAYGAFKLTTNENQPIDASDGGCVRFLTPEIRYSGTTTDGINGAFETATKVLEVAAKVDKQLGGLKFVRLTQDEYDALTTKDGDTLYIIVPTFGGLTVYYGIDGQTAQNEITLFNGGGESSGESSGSEGGGALPTTMIVDGVEETPVNTWRFEEGTHIVQYVFEDNTIPQMFLNNIDYAYEIEIGDDITTIAEDYAGDGVFAGMPALQKATIGKNVTTIGAYAFNNSFNLFTDGIYVKATTPPTLGSNAFDNTDNCPIYVPASAVDEYKDSTSTGWNEYASRIQAIQ